MKPKRVLIASFVLIIAGLFFMLNFEANITGAVAGAPATALNPASSILFGFFLIWIAGIMLVGATEKKKKPFPDLEEIMEKAPVVTGEKFLDDLKKIPVSADDRGFELDAAYADIIRSLGAKYPSQLDKKGKYKAGSMFISQLKLKHVEDFYGKKGVENYIEALEKGDYKEKGKVDESFATYEGVTKKDEAIFKIDPSRKGKSGLVDKVTQAKIEREERWRKNLREKDLKRISEGISEMIGGNLDPNYFIQHPELLDELTRAAGYQEMINQFKEGYKRRKK